MPYTSRDLNDLHISLFRKCTMGIMQDNVK